MGALITGVLLLLSALLPATGNASIFFNNPYPIGQNPQISGTWIFDHPTSEAILFEAEPLLRLPFYNNVYSSFLKEKKRWSQAWYVSYRPQLRMYTDKSLPVRMPSYRILPATQHLWLLKAGGKKFRIIGFNFESGHYSNGQAGCAYGSSNDQDSLCRDIYSNLNNESDLSRMLNRRDGEFSTNMTELSVSYQFGTVDDDDRQDRTHSITPLITLFHDKFWGLLPFGGHSDDDIDIYGKWRGGLNYEYSNLIDNHFSNILAKFLSLLQWESMAARFQPESMARLQSEINLEWIFDAHEHVNPFRAGWTATYFFPNNMGVFAGLYSGHDNYNLRFVDDLPWQLKGGITWDTSPALQFHHNKVK